MPVAHYDASIAWDQKVKRGVPGQVARVFHPVTDLPIDDLLDLDGNPLAALVSNSEGFVEPFTILDGPGHVKLSVGSLRYYIVDLNLVGESAASAVQAALAAQRAADLVEAPADEVVKTLIEGDTLSQGAGDARWVTNAGADTLIGGLLGQDGSIAQEATDARYVGLQDPRLIGKSASIRYSTYGAINYTCITLHVAGKPDPLVLNSFWDEVQRGADFRAREHDIEIARDMTGGTIIANAAGLVHIPGFAHGEGQQVRTRGALVIDGVAIQDFPTDGHWTGYEGFAMLPNGILKGYSGRRGDSVTDAVSDGAVWMESFGPIIVEGGAARDFTDPENFWDAARAIVSSLNVYGQRANGDIVMITCQGTSGSSGGTLADSAAIALLEGCLFAISMDRGGSAQTFKGGVPIVASSDRDVAVLTDYNKRLVANYLYTRLPVTSIAKSDKPALYYVPTLYKPDTGSQSTPRVQVSESGMVQLSGRMVLTPAAEGGTLTEWPTTTASGILRVPPLARPAADVAGIFYGNQKTSGRWQVSAADGVVRISYCDAGMLYALLDQIKWQLDKPI